MPDRSPVAPMGAPAAGEWLDLARRVGLRPLAAALGVIAALIAAAFVLGARQAAPPPLDLPSAAANAPVPVATTAPAAIHVHIDGAVTLPGLYEMLSGYRVGDAVDAAGGPTADADTSRINLAEPLRDGIKVYVPTRGEPMPVGGDANGGRNGGAAGGGGGSSAGVSINSATREQLTALPGIGPALAEAIVRHREAHGPFGSVDALDDVAGIGPATVERLRSAVSLDGVP